VTGTCFVRSVKSGIDQVQRSHFEPRFEAGFCWLFLIVDMCEPKGL
jgi:hypothetical protein